jgi:hypothetical protein
MTFFASGWQNSALKITARIRRHAEADTFCRAIGAPGI